MATIDVTELIDDRPEEGVFRVNRRIFSDPDIFEMEMKYIFEGGWVFLGLSSQIPETNDYLTTRIGRHPVVIMRSKDGSLGCFINSCPHKGAMICHLAKGNSPLHICAYHSWSFDSAGRNRGIKLKTSGAYAPAFDQDRHDLVRIARFAEYRGFMFGSLEASVPPLEEYLGGARALIDLIWDQSPQGVELIPGVVSFTYDANWKLQLENCSDSYHFTSAHPSYLHVLNERARSGSDRNSGSVWDKEKPWLNAGDDVAAGTFSFDEGHVLNWGRMKMSEAHPLYERRDELLHRVGQARRDWMFNVRNLTVFPNVQFAENASSQLRIIRPLAANRTEMLTYCMAPVGESAAARTRRIRLYEDFFNPSGMATPDDTLCYENCQEAHHSRHGEWLQGYARGMTHSKIGGNAYSDALGFQPAQSVAAPQDLYDETVYHAYYRAWIRRMTAALDGEAAVPPRAEAQV